MNKIFRDTTGQGYTIFLDNLNLQQVHELLVRRALKDAKYIQKNAAAKLGITPRALHHHIQKYGITHCSWRKYNGEILNN